MNLEMQYPAMASKKRVLVVDDHAILRTGLATLINDERDLITCGEAENEGAALEAVRQLRPDVAVVDWSLANRDAGEMVATMRRDHPHLPVLVLSIHDELYYADRALRAGASGYVMKREASDKIVEAIRCVATGQCYLSDRAVHGLAIGEFGANEAGGVAAAAVSNARRPIRSRTKLKRLAPALSIVIPVYNSEETIEPLCDLLITELQHSYHLQIVLVDDGSSDYSAAACRRIYNKYPSQVDCLLLARNFGEYNAVMAGLNVAEGDYCVIMDDDFQNPPSEVRNLVEEIKKGHDVVYTRYKTMRQPWFRRLGSWVHNWTATQALGKPAQLYLSSFKIMSRFLVREIVRYSGPNPYLDAIILRTTRKIGVLTVRHEPRKQGKSGYTFRKLVSLWGSIMIAFSVHPLRMMFALGPIMAGVGVVQAMNHFFNRMTVPDAIFEPSEMLGATVWFCSGIVLLGIGLLGEYVGRIHRQMAREPQFIVRTRLRHHDPG